MVTTQQKKGFGKLDLVTKQQQEGFQTLLTTINVIT
jgi:hypothetical protein